MSKTKKVAYLFVLCALWFLFFIPAVIVYMILWPLESAVTKLKLAIEREHNNLGEGNE